MITHLITFATPEMSQSADLCVSSGLWHGCDEIENYHPKLVEHLATDAHRKLLEQPRGFGYWSWKPLIILDAMNRFQEGYVIYSDAGVSFINNINYIIDRMDHDIFLFGNNWDHAHWCKADVLEEVIPLSTGNPDLPWRNTDYTFGKQVQASVIFFRVSGYTRNFVKEWLDWCLFEGGRLIDDSPSRVRNHPEFREHRHDQAILTTLAYREGIKLHYWPASYNDGAFTYEKLPEYTGDDYPILFNHHRRRNHEWARCA